MEQQDAGCCLKKSAAVAACTALAVFYVAILYSPTMILRLPILYDTTLRIRGRAFVVSIIVCFLILSIRGRDALSLLGVYGIRMDHIIEKGD